MAVFSLILFLTMQFAVASPEVLTWSDCIKEVAQKNADLRASMASVRSAQSQVKAARSGYFPQLSANVSYNSSDTATVNANGTATTGAFYGDSLNLSQNLFAGFADVEKVEAAKVQRDIALINLQTAKAKVLFDLKTAYAGMLFAQKNLDVTEAIVKRREENLRMVQLRFEGGSENKGSLLLSKADLEQAKFEKIQNENVLHLSIDQLAKVLGREPGIWDVRVQGEIPSQNVSKEPNFQELAVKIPEYRLAVAQEASAKVALEQAKSGFYPSLNLNGSVFGQGSDLQTQANHWSAGLVLSFPLFSGGKDYYATQAQRSAVVGSSLNRDSATRLAAIHLRDNWSAWSEAVAQSKFRLAFVDANRVRSLIGRNKYRNGLLNFDQWYQIENDYIVKQKEYIAGLKAEWLAEAAWQQTLGQADPAFDLDSD